MHIRSQPQIPNGKPHFKRTASNPPLVNHKIRTRLVPYESTNMRYKFRCAKRKFINSQPIWLSPNINDTVHNLVHKTCSFIAMCALCMCVCHVTTAADFAWCCCPPGSHVRKQIWPLESSWSVEFVQYFSTNDTRAACESFAPAWLKHNKRHIRRTTDGELTEATAHTTSSSCGVVSDRTTKVFQRRMAVFGGKRWLRHGFQRRVKVHNNSINQKWFVSFDHGKISFSTETKPNCTMIFVVRIALDECGPNRMCCLFYIVDTKVLLGLVRDFQFNTQRIIRISNGATVRREFYQLFKTNAKKQQKLRTTTQNGPNKLGANVCVLSNWL